MKGAVICVSSWLGEEHLEDLVGEEMIRGSVEDSSITGNCMRCHSVVGPDDLRPFLDSQCRRIKDIVTILWNNSHVGDCYRREQGGWA